MPVRLTLPLVSIGTPGASSFRVTRQPSGSVGDPEVVTLTRMVPVVGVQVIANVRSVVAAAVTVTDRGLVPCALQFPARSASSTWWTPAARLLRIVSALTAIGWLVP